MGNMVNADPDMAAVAARAIATLDRDLIMFSMPDAEMCARRAGGPAGPYDLSGRSCL